MSTAQSDVRACVQLVAYFTLGIHIHIEYIYLSVCMRCGERQVRVPPRGLCANPWVSTHIRYTVHVCKYENSYIALLESRAKSEERDLGKDSGLRASKLECSTVLCESDCSRSDIILP